MHTNFCLEVNKEFNHVRIWSVGDAGLRLGVCHKHSCQRSPFGGTGSLILDQSPSRKPKSPSFTTFSQNLPRYTKWSLILFLIAIIDYKRNVYVLNGSKDDFKLH